MPQIDQPPPDGKFLAGWLKPRGIELVPCGHCESTVSGQHAEWCRHSGAQQPDVVRFWQEVADAVYRRGWLLEEKPRP